MGKIISAIILTLVVNFSIAAQDSKQKVDPQTTTQTEHCDQTKNHKHRGRKHNNQDCTDKNHKHNNQDCTMNHQNCTDKNHKHNSQDCTMNHQNCTDKNHKHSDTQKK